MIKYLIATAFIFITSPAFSQSIKSDEAKDQIGKTVTVCGKIFNGRFLRNAKSRPTLLNMGGVYPDNHMTIVIYEEDLKQFPASPENYYANTDVCVTGVVIEYQGKPEIIARTSEQIKVVPIVNPATISSTPVRTDNNSTTNATPKTSSTPEKIKAAVSPPAVKKVASTGYEITLTGEVNMRENPRKEAAVVSMLKVGTVVSISNSENGWSFVTVLKSDKDQQAVGKTGYVKNSVLK